MIDPCVCGHEKADHANIGVRGWCNGGCGHCECRLFRRSRARTVPKQLDAVVDVVLAYRPKARSKPAVQRKRRANKIAKEK